MSEGPGTEGVEDALGIPEFLKVANRNKPFNPVGTTAPEPPAVLRLQEPEKLIPTGSAKVAAAVVPGAGKTALFAFPTTNELDFFERGTGGATTAPPGEPMAVGPTPNPLSGDTDASIEFLQERAATHPLWHPQLSFKPTDPVTGEEGLGFETASFARDATGNPDWEKVRRWIDNRQGRGNIYWTVNAAKLMDKKASKTDIIAVVSLHVDLDPLVGEDQFAAEQRLTKKLESYHPLANIIIRSGGGAWGILDLVEPIRTDGDPDKIKEAESYNIQLEHELDGDNCHNIDRVARLPGTTNIPNAKKLAKGRRAKLASVHSRSQVRHTIESFAKAAVDAVAEANRAPLVGQEPTATPAKIAKQVIIWDLVDPPKFDDLNSLPADVAPVARLVLAHGSDHRRLAQELRNAGHECPGGVPYPKKDDPNTNDNSRMALAVIGPCVRAGMSNEDIASLVYNQNYRDAFAHIFSQKDQKRAIQQCVKRAKEDLAREDFKQATGFECPGGWDKSGRPIQNYLNTLNALDALRLEIQFDLFRIKTIINGEAVDKFAGEISDDQVTMIRHVIANRFSFHPHVGDMYDAITARSREHMFNPVVDWLDSLKWDGQPRLDRWMIEHLGADDAPYVCAVSRKTIMAAVRRAKHPGCKFDHMLILCGPQDIGKSFCIADCAGWSDLFSDADLLTKSGKEQLEAVEAKWFYEIAECDGMDKVAVTKTKAFITRQFDRARKAYGRNRSEVPRTCVFIGTSNERELFRDPTGERRFWPVIVTKYDRAAFRANRDQIFAEAVAREASEKLWLDDADQRAEHAKKIELLRARDGIEDTIAELHATINQHGEERLSSAHVLGRLGAHNARDLTDKITKRVAVAMRRCGWVGPLAVRITQNDGKSSVVNGYKRSKEAREEFEASRVPEDEKEDASLLPDWEDVPDWEDQHGHLVPEVWSRKDVGPAPDVG